MVDLDPETTRDCYHHKCTKQNAGRVQTKLKPYKKRATRIIYTCTHDMPYVSATFVTDLPTMSDCRDQQSRKIFNSTLQPTSPLHSLLPPPRDHTHHSPTSSLEILSCPQSAPEQKSISPFFVCSSPLSDLTISSPNINDCIPLTIVLYYCVLFFYYCILFSPLFSGVDIQGA